MIQVSLNSAMKKSRFGLVLLLLSLPTLVSSASCVIQAFGSGLEGKGIHVYVETFGCPGSNSHQVIQKAVDFNSQGEAEVSLNLPVDSFGACISTMDISVTLPYPCRRKGRSINGANWAGFGGGGSCRALEQVCGGKTTIAAVPYFDMWCKNPANFNQPQELKLGWSSISAGDKC